MSQPTTIDIKPEHLAIVKEILLKYLPDNTEVWVFGSRVKGTAKPASDLDIAIDAGRKLTPDELFFLNDAFDESDLPYRVDVVDLQAISSTFKDIIWKDCSNLLGEHVDLGVYTLSFSVPEK